MRFPVAVIDGSASFRSWPRSTKVSRISCWTLSLTLADSGGVSESIFHALPDMVRNFYTVSAWPGHERNLMVPDFAADRCDRVAEGKDPFRIPCGSSGLELSRFMEIVCPECYD